MSKGEGKKIAIKFTEPLGGDVAGNETHFTISGKEYEYVGDVNGELIDTEYEVGSVERYPIARIYQDDFTNGIKDNTEGIAGGVILSTVDVNVNYTDDLTSGLIYISTSDYSASYANYMAFDNNTSTSWLANGKVGHAVGVDFGLGKKISKLRIMSDGRLRNFDLEGSNDNSTWAIVYSGTQLSNSNWQEYAFENSVGYRYYRVKCTGPLHTNHSYVQINEIEMMELLLLDYVGEGDYTTAPIQINGQYRLRWLETKPTNTNIIIEYTTGETQGQWQEVSNADIINSDTNLWIRATLSTAETTVTPTLQDLWIEPSEAPADTIRLTVNDYTKFHNVAGDLTVFYDGAGSLAGFDGPVEEFTESFTPIDLVSKPHQDDQEHIEISSVSATGKLTRIYFSDIDQAEDQGHIEVLGITNATGVLTHIDNI